MATTKDAAIRAIETSILIHRAARAEIEEVIARKKFMRKNVDKERLLKATLNRKIGNLRDFKVELEAANVVVSAPSVGEIAEAHKLIRKIKDLALADAMRAAGLQFLKNAVATAGKLSGKVAVG